MMTNTSRCLMCYTNKNHICCTLTHVYVLSASSATNKCELAFGASIKVFQNVAAVRQNFLWYSVCILLLLNFVCVCVCCAWFVTWRHVDVRAQQGVLLVYRLEIRSITFLRLFFISEKAYEGILVFYYLLLLPNKIHNL